MISSNNQLFRAASQGDADSVKALLAEGFDINASSDRGQTALIMAAFGGHSEIVSLLLAAGADPGIKDSLGLTAEDWAGRRGFANVADILSGKAPATRLVRAKVEQQDTRDKIVTDPPEEELDVEFRKPKSDVTPMRVYKRPTLPGLAGAILREKVGNGHAAENGAPKVANPPLLNHKPDQVVQEQPVGPPAKLANDEVLSLPSGSLTTAPETQQKTTDPLSLPTGGQDAVTPMVVAAAEPSEAAPAVALDDSTLSDETAAKGEAIDEPTLPSGKPQPATPVAPQVMVRTTGRVAAAQAWLEPSEAPNVSHITVPTFSPVKAHSPTRPIVWGLILVMLGISSFVSYRLSNYFFKAQNQQPNTVADVASTPDPTKQVGKLAPVIGGALSGAELIVPDAVYPANLKPGQVSGNVTVEVKVDQRGMVTSARAVDGAQALRAAAVKAAKHAAFSPEKLLNKGQAVLGTITYNFVGSTTAPANPSPSISPIPQQLVTDTSDGAPVVGGPLEGTAVNLPKPEYPASAKSKGISGPITIVVRVNRAGKVISWRSLDGDADLRKAALAAARKATFSPAKLPGDAEVVGTITYNFK